MLIFRASVIFKNKIFAARAAKLDEFWELNFTKIYWIVSNGPVFENRKKVL